MKKKIAMYILCGLLSASVFSLTLMPALEITSYAHGGKTDSKGGHRDNKNKSGLGSYHYHCGDTPAHLHNNGVCDYSGGYSTGSTPQTSSPKSNQNNVTKSQPVQPQNGWKQNNNGWYYQISESTYCQNGFADIGDKIYYFNNAGTMVTGWQNINNEWCYFSPDGSMATGWQYIDYKWYYLDANGRMQTGWQSIGDKWYYFYSDGHMLTGIVDIDGKNYYFNSDGSLDEDWDSNYYEQDYYEYEDWFDDDGDESDWLYD